MSVLPVFSVTYADVISEHYPNRSCIVYGNSYADIDWLGEPTIPKVDLDEKIVKTLAFKYVDYVKESADAVRADASYAVIGTSMPRMFRVYDQKKEQASLFMERYEAGQSSEVASYGTLSSALTTTQQDDLKALYPLLYIEALETTIPLWSLCWAVLDQFRLSGEILDPILGIVEAVRRNKIAEYYACLTEAEIRAVAYPVWPDLSSLQEI
jgi:hypothetical protein